MPASHRFTLSLLPERYAICRLDPAAPLEGWMSEGGFSSITRTPDELSVVCAEDRVLPGAKSEGGWRCLKLTGPFAFDMTGVLVSVLAPLAEAGIGILGISTFDTDYVLIKAENLDAALDALKQAGHQITR